MIEIVGMLKVKNDHKHPFGIHKPYAINDSRKWCQSVKIHLLSCHHLHKNLQFKAAPSSNIFSWPLITLCVHFMYMLQRSALHFYGLHIVVCRFSAVIWQAKKKYIYKLSICLFARISVKKKNNWNDKHVNMHGHCSLKVPMRLHHSYVYRIKSVLFGI